MANGEVWILMTHPDVKGPPVARTLDSFLKHYEKKGWVAVETPPPNPVEASRETFERVFGDIDPKDAVKGPKKVEEEPKQKPKPKAKAKK